MFIARYENSVRQFTLPDFRLSFSQAARGIKKISKQKSRDSNIIKRHKKSKMYPKGKELKQLFDDLCVSLEKTIIVKLKDSNRIRSNMSDPHLRTVCLPDVHQHIFSSVLETKFNDQEKKEELADRNKSMTFELKSINRVNEVFPNGVAKINNSGDVTLVLHGMSCIKML